MTKWLRTITHFLIPFLIILWVVYVNRFPEGFVYNSGDFSQPINLEMHFDELFYTWGNGISAPGEGGPFPWFASSPYYYLFYILPKTFGLSDSQNLSYVLGFFLLLCYASFKVSLKLLFKPNKNLFTTLFPLLYAINMTTLYFFTYTWGFSHHVFLYITLPIVISSFYKLLTEFRLKYLVLYLFTLLISTPGFTNPAFFVALVFFLFLFCLFLLLLKGISINKKFVLNIILISITSLATLLFWILPTLPLIQSNLTGITSGIFNLKEWLHTQSADILSISIGLPGYHSFPPFSHDRIIFYIPVFAIMFTLVFLVSKTSFNNENSNKLKSIFSLLLIEIIFVILLKKSQAPFGDQTIWIYSIPFLSIFRSYEKLAIFLPFINLTAIYGLLPVEYINSKKLVPILVIMLVAPFPFIFGGIQTKYSITIGDDKTKDYLSSKYSGLVKIPTDYFEIANQLNDVEQSNTKIQSLPYSPLNTTAWDNFPKWKLIGFNITAYLFNKPTLSNNSSQYMLYNWIPQQTFTETKINPIWYLRLLSYMDVSNIIYHYDVDNRFIAESYRKIKELEHSGFIKNILDREMVSLYEIEKKQNILKVYSPDKVVITKGEVSDFPDLLIQDNYSEQSLYIFNNDDSFDEYVNDIEHFEILDPLSSEITPAFCSEICYETNIPESGVFELQLSLEGLDKDDLLKTSASLYEINKNGITDPELKSTKKLAESGIGDYITLGNFNLDKDKSYFISLDYVPQKNLIVGNGWKNYQNSANNIRILSKDILDCTPSNYFRIDIDKEANEFNYIITEEIPDFEQITVPEIKSAINGQTDIPSTLKNIVFQGKGPIEYKAIYTVNSVCNFLIEERYADYFDNLKIFKSYKPKLIVKKSNKDINDYSTTDVSVNRINPTKYEVTVSNQNKQFIIVLNESYSPLWEIKSADKDIPLNLEIKSHFIANGFSNGWKITATNTTNEEKYRFKIEYSAQKYYIIGVIISISTIIITSIISVAQAITIKGNKHEK